MTAERQPDGFAREYFVQIEGTLSQSTMVGWDEAVATQTIERPVVPVERVPESGRTRDPS